MGMKIVWFLLFVAMVASKMQYEDANDDEYMNEMYDDMDEMEMERKRDPMWFKLSLIRRRRSAANKPINKCPKDKYAKCEVSQNGCGSGITAKVPMLYREVFTPSCNKHDNCYGCGKMRGWSQDECDNRFYQDMMLACKCNFKTDVAILDCYSKAAVYFNVVQFVGENFYMETSEEFCNKPCMVERASPYVSYKELK